MMRRSGAWVSHGRSSNWSPITGKSESSSEYVKQRHDGRSTHCRTHLSLLTWRWVCQLIYQYQSVIFVVYSPTIITPLSSVWCFFLNKPRGESTRGKNNLFTLKKSMENILITYGRIWILTLSSKSVGSTLQTHLCLDA